MEPKPKSGDTQSKLTGLSLPPAPDVPADELAARLSNIRREMIADKLDVIVLTDVKNIQYFTDFRAVSWYFNSRPFFVVVTANDLILFGADYEEVHVNSKPRGFSALYYAGYADQGAARVAGSIRDLFKGTTPRIAIDYGDEMLGRGSLPLIEALRGLAAGGTVKTASPTLWRVRHIKTRFEAEMKRTAFSICDGAFDDVIAEAHIGITEIELWRKLQAKTFLNGADEANPLPVIFGKGDFTYGRPPSARRLEEGHYVWADFRATYGGYSADRNRIARAGKPKAWELETYKAVRDVTHEWCHLVRPGMTAADLYNEGNKLWGPVNVGNKFSLHTPGAIGVRIGHGSGLDLVETPALGPDDRTAIRPGMILHIEPKLERDGAVFQCEEVFYVLEGGIDFLAPLTPETLPTIR
ncbi:M24 family metallopeptidase [Mesorhizobium sp.]|uniref:M24 family metallopeptidase n=1 Tax=Mesorhizobium sp. TaxID=1871066 RepID=UPI000FEA4045|nr:M24 family metallopeptidase [Mesorhizobium sp.]RWG50756.1 MAG: aminopeptidase P family protein [Mesorhizobium sp.]RWH55728.1 MAG: aminopeptidase P family protein [Mesorhizobium sp.]RWI67765.1 MAG: aminopeptidase P family protein [Mesorhizobium sp.]RWI77721.1 MAG: aminopeptidase P family protein [Mesorhizobium sp.]RWJ02791.1 MAG: aminopeptidase P family protein [Mesorhizobium sp.]